MPSTVPLSPPNSPTFYYAPRLLRARDHEPEWVSSAYLVHGNGLGLSGSQTLSAISGNGAVNDGAAIEAFPCKKHEKKI